MNKYTQSHRTCVSWSDTDPTLSLFSPFKLILLLHGMHLQLLHKVTDVEILATLQTKTLHFVHITVLLAGFLNVKYCQTAVASSSTVFNPDETT